MFLASSTKTKNSFVSIAGFVDLLLQSRQCLFEVRSVPDLALYWNQSCSKKSTNYFCNFQSLVESNGGYDLRPQDHPFGYISSIRPISSYSCGIYHLVQIDRAHPGSTFFFALLLELMGDVVFLVSWLLPVTVPVRSSFLCVVVRHRKEVHRVLDKFLILLFSQEVPARAIDDADVPV